MDIQWTGILVPTSFLRVIQDSSWSTLLLASTLAMLGITLTIRYLAERKHEVEYINMYMLPKSNNTLTCLVKYDIHCNKISNQTFCFGLPMQCNSIPFLCCLTKIYVDKTLPFFFRVRINIFFFKIVCLFEILEDVSLYRSKFIFKKMYALATSFA